MTQGTPKPPRALQRGESSSTREALFILKVASSALLSLAPGHLAEPKDKGNRALQLMAPPGMEGRSGLERLTWRALGEAALKQVSVVTGRLSAPVASSFLCLSHFHHLYHKLVTGSSHCFHSPEEETKAQRS